MDCTTLTPAELAERRRYVSAETDAWLDEIARVGRDWSTTHPSMSATETIGDEAELQGWDLL
jgi:hypothetical protein